MTTYTNTLWRIVQPYGTTYARCGTYSHSVLLNKPECARCGRGAVYARFPRPLTLVWEPDSDVIGDFSWPSGGRTVLKRTVFDALAERFSGIAAEPIVMEQEPKLKRPKRITKRTKPRVWLPYQGPPLVEMWIERTVSHLPSTTFEVQDHCEDCGRTLTRLGGVERVHGRLIEETMDLIPERTPRILGQGLFVQGTDLVGVKIFRVEEFTQTLLCTNEVKAFVEERGFTNVAFLEYGNVVD